MRTITSVAVVSVVLAIAFPVCSLANESSGDVFIEATSGCKVFDSDPKPGVSVQWTGRCVDGYAAGAGELVWSQGGTVLSKNHGTFTHGRLEGHGDIRNGEGQLRYEGDFRNGYMDGNGTRYYDNGRYVGHWSDGHEDGVGSFFSVDGQLRYQGHWSEGRTNGPGTMYLTHTDVVDGPVMDGDRLVATWDHGQTTDGALLTDAQGNIRSVRRNGTFVSFGGPQDAPAAAVVAVDDNDDNDDESNDDSGRQALNAAFASFARGAANLAVQHANLRAARATGTTQLASARTVPARAIFAAATATSVNAGTSNDAPTHRPQGQPATGCVSQSGLTLVNGCNQTVSVVWCTNGAGFNCDRGRDMESDIPAGGRIPAAPLAPPGSSAYVNFYACAGANTAVAHGWDVKCDAPM